MFLLDNIGLRTILLLGAGLNALGNIIKCISILPNLFWIGFGGQFIAAFAKCLIFPVPLKIASTWFPANQISLAASLGAIGYESGWAFGYLISPLVITGPIKTFENISGFNRTFPEDWKNSEKWNLTAQATDEVKNQIMILFLSFTAVCVLVFLIMIFLVTDGPKLPPSRASHLQSLSVEQRRAIITSKRKWKKFIDAVF